MSKKSRRSACTRSLIETLENRTLFSAAPALHSAVPAAAHAAVVKNEATTTTVTVSAGTLGQPITFTVSVRALAANGSYPLGTVNLTIKGTVLDSLTLEPTNSPNPKFNTAGSVFTYTYTAGGSDYFFGAHAVVASYVPEGTFNKSTGVRAFNVRQPNYTYLGDGVRYATVAAGSGPQITTGQTAGVLYTGFLFPSGKLFDDSTNDGGTPLSFAVGGTSVVKGFTEGTNGMEVGETRVVFIPPYAGYGINGSGSTVPSNAILVFIITLESIS